MGRRFVLAVVMATAAALFLSAACTNRSTAPACTDANIESIQASNYDQSCKTDTDCVNVFAGNPCQPCLCPNGGAINRNAFPRYESDISGFQEKGDSVCNCPLSINPCCVGGVCHADDQCESPPPSKDAAPFTDADTDAATNGASPPSTCHWPASLDDAGPGACAVGRAYVKCAYPSGVSCEGGVGASSAGGLTMLCISDDPTSCSGCSSTAGAPTCTDMCAPNEYALSCGGPPMLSPDGGLTFAYQQAPANCVGVGGTPGGNEYSCCPCE